ncbi:hypothetical protein BOTBODRAFT_51574 [Botryobasidium botryosum FD-172 SS1]|uniref:Uncharacterized protein n=1 Tax=Botryobasidium botryosum (strain FD-172 SS1) TaxID=930990 RepID=A0A067MWY7_BOTB1|nr:hypothetical protein BOTBODRAFT_51574 [Botryobasidium botryosum FD-172 SS1]
MSEREIQENERLPAAPELYISLLYRFALNVGPKRDRRNRESDPVLSDASSFMADDNDDRYRAERIIPLLDALAAICVQRSKQTFAVTMSLSHEGVKLYVAENKVVPIGVVEHLKEIWSLVHQVSSKLHPPISTPLPSTQASPTFTSDPSASSLICQIEHKIYAFSFLRLRQRFRKRWSRMEKFLTFMVSSKDIPWSLAAMFMQLGNELDQPKCPDSVPGTIREIRAGLKFVRFFEREDHWAAREEDFLDRKQTKKQGEMTTGQNGGSPINAYRHILKLLSLDDHVRAIIDVASSRRLSDYIRSSTFDVEVIEPYTRTNVDINPSSDFVERIARSVFLDDDPEREVKVSRVVRKARDWRRYDKRMTYSAHCECTLLSYHLEHSEETPLRYIGVSKLLCLACRLFIEAYNAHASTCGHRPFYYKGTHSKLCTDWIALLPRPDASQRDHDFLDTVAKTMAERAEDWLKHRMEMEAGSGRHSDSTTASDRPDTMDVCKNGKEARAETYPGWKNAVVERKSRGKLLDVLASLWRRRPG